MAIVRDARQFSFVVQGMVPPCAMTDDELRLYIASMRALVLTIMAGALVAVPNDAQQMGADITIGPAIFRQGGQS